MRRDASDPRHHQELAELQAGGLRSSGSDARDRSQCVRQVEFAGRLALSRADRIGRRRFPERGRTSGRHGAAPVPCRQVLQQGPRHVEDHDRRRRPPGEMGLRDHVHCRAAGQAPANPLQGGRRERRPPGTHETDSRRRTRPGTHDADPPRAGQRQPGVPSDRRLSQIDSIPAPGPAPDSGPGARRGSHRGPVRRRFPGQDRRDPREDPRSAPAADQPGPQSRRTPAPASARTRSSS